MTADDNKPAPTDRVLIAVVGMKLYIGQRFLRGAFTEDVFLGLQPSTHEGVVHTGSTQGYVDSSEVRVFSVMPGDFIGVKYPYFPVSIPSWMRRTVDDLAAPEPKKGFRGAKAAKHGPQQSRNSRKKW